MGGIRRRLGIEPQACLDRHIGEGDGLAARVRPEQCRQRMWVRSRCQFGELGSLKNSFRVTTAQLAENLLELLNRT